MFFDTAEKGRHIKACGMHRADHAMPCHNTRRVRFCHATGHPVCRLFHTPECAKMQASSGFALFVWMWSLLPRYKWTFGLCDWP